MRWAEKGSVMSRNHTSIDKDFATNKSVNGVHPEEVVRQEYERILHFDLGYPKECMDIEVLVQMGASKKSCDIAIYDNKAKRNIIGIVETKRPGDMSGKEQLKSYMSATPTCRWGVWTNGDELECASRNIETGKIVFDGGLTVPRHGYLDAYIENFSALKPASNLKWIFRQINNRLYANTNLARTEKQGAEMVRLIFCKLMDEYNIRGSENAPDFQVYKNEKQPETRRRINKLWEKTKESHIGDSIFKKTEKIEIDNYSLQLIVSTLQGYSLLNTKRDTVGDAFEVFSERQFAGEKGQFFTPRGVVKMIIDIVNPLQGEKIIDPACGSGGFLVAALNHIAADKGDDEKRSIAEHTLYGIDKDADLSKICKAHMSIIGDGKSNIVTADSLKNPQTDWDDHAKSKLLDNGELRKFDILITNPPFGSKIKVDQEHVLRQYDLGHKWEKTGGKWKKTQDTKPTPPQILFIERCFSLLKEGGRMGIVLPDGILGNPRDDYIRQWIKEKAKILAVIDCPTETFSPHTSTKTSVLIMRKHECPHKTEEKEGVFFAIAEHCGHTHRGKDIFREDGTIKEDFNAISNNYNTLVANSKKPHLGFTQSKLHNGILVPRYYDPRIVKVIKTLKREKNVSMISIEELEQKGDILVSSMPASARAEEYDIQGTIRFIRTSDISGYELYNRTQKMISVDTYSQYKERQNLQIGDILFVKDGDDKIGETAILLDENDLQILVQTHFKKIRPLKIDRFLLLYLLNTEIVKKQIRQRVFSQSTLRTIGSRVEELLLPIPANKSERTKIIRNVKNLIVTRRDSLRKLQKFISANN